MATMQAEDMHASFLSVGELNADHQECLGSTATNHHGVVSLTLQLCLVVMSWLSA